MKTLEVFGLLLVAATVVAINGKVAPECNPRVCHLPDCRCSSTDIPGNLDSRDIPQFITITFDDGINVNNIQTYRRILYNRQNANGCNSGATFYVSHEYTNYQAVNELYNRGFEIALHSITHQTPQTYWFHSNYDDMVKEFGHQKSQLAYFANIPYDSIKGMRIPFLQMTGDESFKMMVSYNLTYDHTWPTIRYINPGLWPYTLHYSSIQDCIVPPCPESSIPGPWVMPMVSWLDLRNVPCSFVDACFWTPDRTDEEGWFQFILANFNRHYSGNRAPFGFYIHEWFLSAFPAVENALIRFLNVVNSLSDTFVVNSNEVIEWVRNPVSIDEYMIQDCRRFTPTTCNHASCGPLRSSHNTMDYWMQTCSSCPRVYPWINNHLGL